MTRPLNCNGGATLYKNPFDQTVCGLKFCNLNKLTHVFMNTKFFSCVEFDPLTHDVFNKLATVSTYKTSIYVRDGYNW